MTACTDGDPSVWPGALWEREGELLMTASTDGDPSVSSVALAVFSLSTLSRNVSNVCAKFVL